MEIQANKDFEVWAKSYSGCNGGNIKGAFWFCGIEFGGGVTEENLKFHEVVEPSYIGKDRRNSFKKSQYNWKILKLYSVITGNSPKNYKQVYLKSDVFNKESDAFKLNLYPIAFKSEKDELWKEWHYRKTGLPTKHLYQAWCQIHRFTVMRHWVTKNNPRVIICTGSTYMREFFLAFAGEEKIYGNTQYEEQSIGNLGWQLINNRKTLLFVIPFLGQGGLKSDRQIQEYGERIKELCENVFGLNWHQPVEI